MQSNRRPQTISQPAITKARVQTPAVATRPVELDLETLKQVAGGASPKGTWDAATAQSPKGTW